jgi:hypothetical protein
MNLDLSDEDMRDLASILKRLIDETKYPFSPEAYRWKELLGKLDPEAIKPRDPLPPVQHYEPPRATAARRRRARR